MDHKNESGQYSSAIAARAAQGATALHTPSCPSHGSIRLVCLCVWWTRKREYYEYARAAHECEPTASSMPMEFGACEPLRRSLLGEPSHAMTGHAGGSWSYCTHVTKYGMNFDFGLAQALLTLSPRSTLEFGCGLGLYTSFLHRALRTVPSVAMEPQPMPSSIFGSSSTRSAHEWPEQLVGDFVTRSGAHETCEMELPRVELVFSIEVAEHIPPHLHDTLADLLVRHTSRFLVFSAGRPGQSGHGHIGNRQKHEWLTMFQRRGLISLNRTTAAIASASRNPEIRRNVMAFALPHTTTALGSTAVSDSLFDPFAGIIGHWQPVNYADTSAVLSGAAKLGDVTCMRGVTPSGKSRGGCNAAVAAPLSYSADPRVRRTLNLSGEIIAWPPGVHNRLRKGELEIWPNLIRQLSVECFAFGRVKSPMAVQSS